MSEESLLNTGHRLGQSGECVFVCVFVWKSTLCCDLTQTITWEGGAERDGSEDTHTHTHTLTHTMLILTFQHTDLSSYRSYCVSYKHLTISCYTVTGLAIKPNATVMK